MPQGTRDFSAILLKVQQHKPEVVAAAVGGDDLKAMRAQVSQMKLGDQVRLDQQPARLARRLRACRAPICSASSARPGTRGSSFPA